MYIVKQKPSEPLFSSRGRGNCVRGRAPRLFCEPNLRDWSLTSHFRRPAPSLSRSDIDWGSQKRVVRAWSFTVRLCLPFLRPRTRRKRTMGGERGWGGGGGSGRRNFVSGVFYLFYNVTIRIETRESCKEGEFHSGKNIYHGRLDFLTWLKNYDHSRFLQYFLCFFNRI